MLGLLRDGPAAVAGRVRSLQKWPDTLSQGGHLGSGGSKTLSDSAEQNGKSKTSSAMVLSMMGECVATWEGQWVLWRAGTGSLKNEVLDFPLPLST